MVELGQLEKEHKLFDDRSVRIIAVSNDDLKDTQETQAKFPHLVIVSDPQQAVAKAADVIHPGMAPGGGDTNAPTTFLIDGDGYVRHLYRPKLFTTRLTPKQLLAVIDETWK